MPRKKKEEVIKKEKVEEKPTKKVEPAEEKPKRSIVKYFFGMLLLFALVQIAIEAATGDLSSLVLYYKYGNEILGEIFYAILVLIVMLLFHNSYVFTNRQEKLGKSLLYAFPLIGFSVFVFTFNVLNLKAVSFQSVIGLLVLCALIGVTEEFLCRGWLLNEFLERFGDNKRNIITSIALSSVIFGLMHITNVVVTSQTMFETSLQIINAITFGFLLGSVYYKTKNIWSVIILHAFYDFSIMIGEINMVKECTYGVVTNKILFINLFATAVLSIFWILGAIIVLKRCNYPEGRSYASKTFYLTMVPLLIFTFIVSVVPYENMIEDYDDYYVCYNYKELKVDKDFVQHYPVYETYRVKYSDTKNSLIIDPETNDLNETVTISEYDFALSLNASGDLVFKNNNTGKKVIISDDYINGYVLFENDKNFVILYSAVNNKLEQEIFISDVMLKEDISNSEDFLGIIKTSFRKLELPDIVNIGYITFDKDETKYPLFTSSEHDAFIYKDGEVLLIK